MTFVSRVGHGANNAFNQTFGRFCEQACKLTCSDKTAALVNSLRFIDGNLKGLIDTPKMIPALASKLNWESVGSFLKPYSVVVADAKNFLTFLELFEKVAKWKKTDVTKTSWFRLGNQAFGICQKTVETFVLMPTKWKLYDLGAFSARVGGWVGFAVNFVIIKDAFMVSSGLCGIIASFQDIAKAERDIAYRESKFTGIRLDPRLDSEKPEKKRFDLSELNDEIYLLRNGNISSESVAAKIARLENKFIYKTLHNRIIKNEPDVKLDGVIDAVLNTKLDSAYKKFNGDGQRLTDAISEAKTARRNDKIAAQKLLIKEKHIAIGFDVSKTALGVFTIGLSTLTAPATLAGLKFAAWTAGWFVGITGGYRSYFSAWGKPEVIAKSYYKFA